MSLKLNFIHREDCILFLFHVLNNNFLQLNEVLIHVFVAVSLTINAILTQYTDGISAERLGPHRNECPWYNIKQSGGEAPAREL